MKALIIILALLLSIAVEAATVGGVALPTKQGELDLHGAGLLRKGFIFKVYVGALYVENEKDTSNILSEVPKRIDIHYFHHTPKRFMVREAEKVLERNFSREELKKLRGKIDQLHEAYVNGEKGARASLVYEPDRGLTYYFEDRVVVNIPCDDFANAYFAIWLGEKPSSRTMKRAMLEGAKG